MTRLRFADRRVLSGVPAHKSQAPPHSCYRAFPVDRSTSRIRSGRRPALWPSGPIAARSSGPSFPPKLPRDGRATLHPSRTGVGCHVFTHLGWRQAHWRRRCVHFGHSRSSMTADSRDSGMFVGTQTVLPEALGEPHCQRADERRRAHEESDAAGASTDPSQSWRVERSHC